jgi:Fic family protein
LFFYKKGGGQTIPASNGQFTLAEGGQFARFFHLSDKEGKSTKFIEYMLKVIDNSLATAIGARSPNLTAIDRINYFLEITDKEFSRKDYLAYYKSISTATASRDLLLGVELGIIKKKGTGNKSKYIKNYWA